MELSLASLFTIIQLRSIGFFTFFTGGVCVLPEVFSPRLHGEFNLHAVVDKCGLRR